MKAKPKSIKGNKSAVAIALEAGKPVKGMIGYVPISHDGEEIYVKVRCTGITTENCGVSLKAALVSGSGEIDISPCQWLDSIDKIKNRSLLKSKQEAARSDFKGIMRRHYSHERSAAMQVYAKERMTSQQHADWLKHAYAVVGSESLAKVSSDQVRKLARVACLVVNGLAPDEAPQDYDFTRDY